MDERQKFEEWFRIYAGAQPYGTEQGILREIESLEERLAETKVALQALQEWECKRVAALAGWAERRDFKP